jgi:2'-5' RNA ligase
MNRTLEPRLFVAFPLPQQMKKQLGEWTKSKRNEWSFSKWVYEQDIHLTLHFLGNTTSQQMGEIISVLTRISNEQVPFQLGLKGIGIFGKARKPRVLWAGVEGELDHLHQLQKEVTTALSPIGFPPEDRPYCPHVTLARNYMRNDFLSHSTSGENPWGTMNSEWTVDQILLYETKLGQEPMYHAIYRFPFSGTRGVENQQSNDES